MLTNSSSLPVSILPNYFAILRDLLNWKIQKLDYIFSFHLELLLALQIFTSTSQNTGVCLEYKRRLITIYILYIMCYNKSMWQLELIKFFCNYDINIENSGETTRKRKLSFISLLDTSLKQASEGQFHIIILLFLLKEEKRRSKHVLRR